MLSTDVVRRALFGDQHQNMKCGPGAKKIWRAALAFQIHQNGRKNNGC